MNPFDRFCGLAVRTDPTLTEFARVEHDRSRFIEYDDRDEGWRRYFGFVTTEKVPSSTVYQIGNTLIMHPAVLEKIKREAA